MNHLTAIPIQKLFLVTIVLKVMASGLGWFFGDPWVLGFTVPLLIMGGYIIIGYRREDSEVSDEKFADTCYYLGFIFTISSIIFSLFDLPNIGTKLSEIAVRFGAAMVSTVFGLVVRVYLVSFKRDIADAVAAAEVSVIDAASKFREQLMLAIDGLKDFEHKVDEAARGTVHRVETQIEATSKQHAERLDKLFGDAHARISAAVEMYTKTMAGSVDLIEKQVNGFALAVNARLKNTVFPDDFFASRLQGPLTALVGNFNEANIALTQITKNLKAKVAQTEKSISSIVDVADGQQQIVAKLAQQLAGMQTISNNMTHLTQSLTSLTNEMAAYSGNSASLTQSINELQYFPASMSNLHQALSSILIPIQEQTQASREFATTMRQLFDRTLELTNVVAANNGQIHAAIGEFPRISDMVSDMHSEITAFGDGLQALTDKLGNLQVTVNLPTTHLNFEPSINQDATKPV